jgi:phosphotransferase system  glucose/maltose/N-acetylglucosamine-specific IIC component
MISLLAKFFRGLHMFVGITPPPPGHNERSFVLVWLGMILFVVVFCGFLFLLIAKLYHF